MLSICFSNFNSNENWARRNGNGEKDYRQLYFVILVTFHPFILRHGHLIWVTLFNTVVYFELKYSDNDE